MEMIIYLHSCNTKVVFDMLYQAHAKIHLRNIKRNLENLRQFINKEARLLLAMKANAYGHDAVAVATMAEHYGLVDWLGVATVPEGLELRREGVKLPILKFSPAFPEEMEAALEARLTLAVCDYTNARQLQALCKQRRLQANVHLKVDMGMGRLGIEAQGAPDLAAFIETQCPNLRMEGLFTHLPLGDQIQGHAFTQNQIAAFRTCIEDISNAVKHPPTLNHCASSGAILEHRNSWFDMVRSGTLAYGYYPMGYPKTPLELAPGLTLASRVAYLKKIKKGQGIGYGLTWTADRDTWIATMPIGYADGLDRRLSNRGRVLIKGNYYPLVGLICMDQTMIDLGPSTDITVGEEVILIGKSGNQEITIYEIAELLGTIPCDIACQIGPRIKRLINNV